MTKFIEDLDQFDPADEKEKKDIQDLLRQFLSFSSSRKEWEKVKNDITKADPERWVITIQGWVKTTRNQVRREIHYLPKVDKAQLEKELKALENIENNLSKKRKSEINKDDTVIEELMEFLSSEAKSSELKKLSNRLMSKTAENTISVDDLLNWIGVAKEKLQERLLEFPDSENSLYKYAFIGGFILGGFGGMMVAMGVVAVAKCWAKYRCFSTDHSHDHNRVKRTQSSSSFV